MSRRDLREALEIMGRQTVTDALAHRAQAKAFWLANHRDFQEAARRLRGLLRNAPAATAYVETLTPEMRRALTAAWIGDIDAEHIAEMGLDLRPGSTAP